MATLLLTPENIQNQQFHVRFRGFDVDEVDAFLEKVAENYLVLVKDNEKLKDAMAAVEGERDQIQSQERTFKNAIISAQNIADEMQAKARQEAHVLKENARLEAAAMIDEAREQKASLKEQISSLLLEKQQLKNELQDFLTFHMERLDSQYPAIGQAVGTTKTEPTVKTAPPHPSISADIGSSHHATPAAIEIPQVSDESEHFFREDPDQAEEDDLADLYEKIDLSEFGEDGLVEPGPTPAAHHDPGPEKSATHFATDELDDIDDLTMPDLDGDMLFTLDDPLDNQPGPAVDIDPMEENKKYT